MLKDVKEAMTEPTLKLAEAEALLDLPEFYRLLAVKGGVQIVSPALEPSVLEWASPEGLRFLVEPLFVLEPDPILMLKTFFGPYHPQSTAVLAQSLNANLLRTKWLPTLRGEQFYLVGVLTAEKPVSGWEPVITRWFLELAAVASIVEHTLASLTKSLAELSDVDHPRGPAVAAQKPVLH